MAATLQVQRAVAMDATGPESSGRVPRIVTSLAGLGQGSSDDVPRPLPVRTRERKPSKKSSKRGVLACAVCMNSNQMSTMFSLSAAPQPEPEPEAMPSKRQRRAPSWLAEAVVDEVPQVISEQIQAKVDAMPGKPNKFGTTRFVNWKLLDKENMIVELEYSGKKYRGVLAKTGVSPTAGIVQEVNALDCRCFMREFATNLACLNCSERVLCMVHALHSTTCSTAYPVLDGVCSGTEVLTCSSLEACTTQPLHVQPWLWHAGLLLVLNSHPLLTLPLCCRALLSSEL